jgi:hypothetical protein
MRRIIALLVVLFVPLFLNLACGGDTTGLSTDNGGTTVQGEIGTADFELVVGAATGPGHPLDGPFILRGTNLHYEDSLQALVVDLTVRNSTRQAHPEPIVLTFVDLIPASVTVLNPDNGINGDGAEIVFPFANDDGVWTPGEVSLPRTVQFGVEKGVSIGFVARLNVGQVAGRNGLIGGVVWLDADRDSVRDDGEPGVPGVPVMLSSAGGDPRGKPIAPRVVLTAPDGHYVFRDLPAGSYVVTKMPSMRAGAPTTPTQIYVLLGEDNGNVGDFLDANFGCAPPPPGPR